VANLSRDNLVLKDIVWEDDQITVQISCAKDLRRWLADAGAKTLYIETPLPLEERLLRKLQTRDEFSMVRSSTQRKKCVCGPND
jgi:hypothetical protein